MHPRRRDDRSLRARYTGAPMTRRDLFNALVGLVLGMFGFLLFCLSIVLGGWLGFWLAGSPGGG